MSGAGERVAFGEGDALTRFDGFERVILVANSDAVHVADLQARHTGALFVFFNKVYKVVDRPFAGDAVLVARSGPAGANIVYRREVADVLRLVSGPGFRGIVNLRVGARERFSPAADFEGATVAHLDLQPMFAGFYPSTHVPTSGFALALALAERLGSGRVVLAGFTARRSEAWKLFHDHDWTFEQVAMRALARSGLIAMEPGRAERSPFDALCERFPAVSRDTVALVSAEVLGERLEGTNMTVDRLVSVTKPLARIDRVLRGLKPKTRKEKLAEKGGG